MFSWVTFETLQKWTGGTWSNATLSDSVDSLSTDTRSIQPGQVFLALRGENFDGHRFLDSQEVQRAAAVIVDQPYSGPIPSLQVQDTLQALIQLGEGMRGSFQGKTLAVTGSAGKSSTKDMLATLCGDHTIKSPASFNNLIGVSKTALLLEDSTKTLVLEMGMNALGEISELCSHFKPEFGLITNIGDAHIGKLGGLEFIYQAKKEMFDWLSESGGKAAVNIDDEKVVKAFRESYGSEPLVTYSALGKEAVVSILSSKLDPKTGFLNLEVKVRGERVSVALPIFGKHQSQNIAAAIALAELAGISQWHHQLPGIRPADHRGEVHLSPGGLTVIDESYNSNPTALKSSLDSLYELDPSLPKYVVLGEMLELGKFSESRHLEVGEYLATLQKRWGGDLTVFAYGQEAKGFLKPLAFMGDRCHFAESVSLIEAELGQVRSAGWCLVKGSRGNRLEKVVNSLLHI